MKLSKLGITAVAVIVVMGGAVVASVMAYKPSAPLDKQPYCDELEKPIKPLTSCLVRESN